MFKVNYHYDVGGVAKQFVAEVFMTEEEAIEYVLEKFDNNIESRNEHDEHSRLGEGRVAEICAEVIRNSYSIEVA